ncbi:MAG: hypothetical protein PHS79_01635 [Patescibacteria group bacterium]|nr:hypothetical protein [Patescibacteria group bacterium]
MFSAIALAGGTHEHAKWLRLRNGRNARLVQAITLSDFVMPVGPSKRRELTIDDRFDNLPGKTRHATVVILSDAGYDDEFAELLCESKNAERFVAAIDLAMTDKDLCAKIGMPEPEAAPPSRRAALTKSARKKKFVAIAKVSFNHLSEDELHRTYLAMQRAGFNRRHVNWICNRGERFVRIVESQIDAEKREWIDESGFVIESELRKKMAQPDLESINDMPGLIRRLMNEVIADAGGTGKHSLWIQRANRAECLLSYIEAAMRADMRSAKETTAHNKASRISNFPPAKRTVVQTPQSPGTRTFTQVLRGVGLLGNKKTAEKAVSRISEIPAAQNVEVQVPEVRVEAAAEVNFDEWRIRDDEAAGYFSRSLAEAGLSTESRAEALADDDKTYVDLDGLSDEEKLAFLRKFSRPVGD